MNEEIESLKKLKSAADSICQAVGNAKLPVIAKAFEDEEVAEALTMLLDPMVTIGIGEKSLDKVISKPSETYYDSLVFMCKHLSKKKGITDQDIRSVQHYLERVRAQDEDLARFAKEFITKTLTIGATAKTVNKALGREVIPEFKCMLANKYFEHTDAVDGKDFAITEKLDGIRCLAVVKNGEKPCLYSRQGQLIDGLVDIEAELSSLHQRTGIEFVLDGELLIADRNKYPSKEQYKLTTKIVRKDGEKHGVEYNVFDIVGVDVFSNHNCDTPYYMRRQKLDALVRDTQFVKAHPVLCVGKDPDLILEHLNQQRSLNHEGVMVNLLDAPYEFKRTNSILKVKVMNDCDLEIIGIQEGTGRFKGTLGSLIVSYKGNPVGVGSGLSDEMRKSVWQKPNRYIGRVATIQYFEETMDKTGKLSIRFPVFKELREEGKEVSYS